jgi:hypothetical protein
VQWKGRATPWRLMPVTVSIQADTEQHGQQGKAHQQYSARSTRCSTNPRPIQHQHSDHVKQLAKSCDHNCTAVCRTLPNSPLLPACLSLHRELVAVTTIMLSSRYCRDPHSCRSASAWKRNAGPKCCCCSSKLHRRKFRAASTSAIRFKRKALISALHFMNTRCKASRPVALLQ